MSKTYLHLKMLDHLASKVNSLTVGQIMRAMNLKFLHQKYKRKTDLLILIASIASMKFIQYKIRVERVPASRCQPRQWR